MAKNSENRILKKTVNPIIFIIICFAIGAAILGAAFYFIPPLEKTPGKKSVPYVTGLEKNELEKIIADFEAGDGLPSTEKDGKNTLSGFDDKTADSEPSDGTKASAPPENGSTDLNTVNKDLTANGSRESPLNRADTGSSAVQKENAYGITESNRSPLAGGTDAVTDGGNPLPAPPEIEPRGTLIFVFDDAGYNPDHLKPFLKLPFPCTIAVLPQLPASKEAAEQIRTAGKELILHQPMQAINVNIDPGPGAVKPGMSADEIKEVVRTNIAELSPLSGMNNHEGSLITADEQAMKTVLEVCREQKLFFLDSRTTIHSAVPKAAKALGFPVWERSVFLDNEKTIEYMEKQIMNGLEIAEKTGISIMIGHVFTTELAELLLKMYPLLVKEGFHFSTISMQKQNRRIVNHEN